MKKFYNSFKKSLPFTTGIILILTSLSFLAEFTTEGLEFESDEYLIFIFFALIGIPTLLFGINKLSNEEL